MLSECFIDAKDKTGLFATKSEVETYVYATLELPPVAYAIVWENLAPTHSREFRENRTCADPYYYAVSSPYVLPQLDANVNLAFVAIASFEISAHIVAAAEG